MDYRAWAQEDGSSTRSSEQGGRDLPAALFTDRWVSQSLMGESPGGPGSREFGECVLCEEPRCINVTEVSSHAMSEEGGRAVLANDVGIRHDT